LSKGVPGCLQSFGPSSVLGPVDDNSEDDGKNEPISLEELRDKMREREKVPPPRPTAPVAVPPPL